MQQLKIHVKNYDEKLPAMRTIRVLTMNKEIRTPCRALSLGDNLSESRLIKADDTRGINELYRNINREKIEEIKIDTKSGIKFGNSLRNTLNKSDLTTELNLLLFSYENKDIRAGKYQNSMPSREEIDVLCDITSHPLCDVIIPPRIFGLPGDKYVQFLDLFFTALRSRSNFKPIMGFLPFLARNDFLILSNFYKKNEVFSFIADFEGNNPIDSYIYAALVNQLATSIRKDYHEEVYIHALNVPFSRIKQKVDITPAKDIVTFSLGIDSFGTSHLKQRLPLNVVQEIKRRTNKKSVRWFTPTLDSFLTDKSDQIEIFRLFNRSDYGYYRSDLNDITSLMGSESRASIDLSQLYDDTQRESRVKRFRKAFNVERQALEAAELRTIISENNALSYLQNKKYLAKDKWNIIALMNK